MRRDPVRSVTAHCRLSDRVRVVRQASVTWLVGQRPFRLLRIHPKLARLTEALQHDSEVQSALEKLPELRWETAIEFLERLADEGLVELRWSVPDDWFPTVSIVIPVRNRPVQLDACLAAIARLDYPSDRLEVIAVDDASTDDTAARAAAWQGRLPLRVLRMDEQVGAAECRNQGAVVARGEILAFTDSDCQPHPQWLRVLVPEFVRPGVAAVGGAVLPADEESWLDRYEAVESPLTHGWEPARVRPRGAVPYLVTANLLVRWQAFLELGGFARIHPGEDVDLVWRLCERGGRVLYRPAGIVYHDHRDRWWPFLRRRASYATSEVVLVQRHPAYRHRMVVPVAAVTSLIGLVWGGRRRRIRILLAALPLVLDMVAAVRTARWTGAPVGMGTIVRAELRGTVAAVYWIGRTVSRYFSGPAAALGMLTGRCRAGRWLLGSVVASLVGTAAADWVHRRPRLDPWRFVAAHVLDDLANNVGLLIGCLRERTLRPLLVELVWYWPRAREW